MPWCACAGPPRQGDTGSSAAGRGEAQRGEGLAGSSVLWAAPCLHAGAPASAAGAGAAPELGGGGAFASSPASVCVLGCRGDASPGAAWPGVLRAVPLSSVMSVHSEVVASLWRDALAESSPPTPRLRAMPPPWLLRFRAAVLLWRAAANAESSEHRTAVFGPAASRACTAWREKRAQFTTLADLLPTASTARRHVAGLPCNCSRHCKPQG